MGFRNDVRARVLRSVVLLLRGAGVPKERVLERSYSITCSKGGGKNGGFWWFWERFWDRVLRIRIQLRVQKVFGNVVHFGGPAPVLGSCLSIPIQLRVHKEVQK